MDPFHFTTRPTGTVHVWSQDDRIRCDMSETEFHQLRDSLPETPFVEHETAPPPGFLIQVVEGVEVFRGPPGLTVEQTAERAAWPDDFTPTPIGEEPLRVGDVILVPNLGGGLAVGTVQDHGGPIFVGLDGMLGLLMFGSDHRRCWTCPGLVHSRATTYPT